MTELSKLANFLNFYREKWGRKRKKRRRRKVLLLHLLLSPFSHLKLYRTKGWRSEGDRQSSLFAAEERSNEGKESCCFHEHTRITSPSVFLFFHPIASKSFWSPQGCQKSSSLSIECKNRCRCENEQKEGCGGERSRRFQSPSLPRTERKWCFASKRELWNGFNTKWRKSRRSYRRIERSE